MCMEIVRFVHPRACTDQSLRASILKEKRAALRPPCAGYIIFRKQPVSPSWPRCCIRNPKDVTRMVAAGRRVQSTVPPKNQRGQGATRKADSFLMKTCNYARQSECHVYACCVRWGDKHIVMICQHVERQNGYPPSFATRVAFCDDHIRWPLLAAYGCCRSHGYDVCVLHCCGNKDPFAKQRSARFLRGRVFSSPAPCL